MVSGGGSDSGSVVRRSTFVVQRSAAAVRRGTSVYPHTQVGPKSTFFRKESKGILMVSGGGSDSGSVGRRSTS